MSTSTPPDAYYLFTSFRGKGEDGLYLALSRDAYRWTSLTGDRPFVSCVELNTRGVRDPMIAAGPDGVFHLVWTGGTGAVSGGAAFGYASSRDLIHWEDPRGIAVMEHESEAINAWAPKLFYDEEAAEWLVLWSSTIPNRFPPTVCLPGWEKFNNRIYAATTRDFVTFTPSRLFFDSGDTCIDATIIRALGRCFLVYKEDRFEAEGLRLHLATADRLHGPYQKLPDPITPPKTEGASAIEIEGWFYVYYDHYWQPQHYGAVRTRDFQTWENVTAQMRFPADHRHGSIVRVPAAIVRGLLARAGLDPARLWP